LSTGYAGLIGAAAARRHSVPFLLTEHGLYWREAEQGGEFECGVAAPQSAAATRTWVARLREYARCAYDAADVITAVCDANRALQLSLGAEPARSVVIANGVEVPGAQVCARPAGDRGVLRVGLVGRVTPIKGTTTFLEACRVVQGAVARAEFYVVGPGDHSPEYDAECRQLAHRLRLERVTFTGEVDVRDWYPRLDVVVLTSRSEAQPLALLEAMAYGRPVVATDVGGCRELVEGPADAFGAAGVVCPPGDAGAVARAIVRVGARPEQFAQAGRARVAALYTRRRMLDRYRALYGRLLSGAAGPRRPSNGPAPAPAQRVPATSG
jgi:glycosyltransferase involved in cell wall biosynthesis